MPITYQPTAQIDENASGGTVGAASTTNAPGNLVYPGSDMQAYLEYLKGMSKPPTKGGIPSMRAVNDMRNRDQTDIYDALLGYPALRKQTRWNNFWTDARNQAANYYQNTQPGQWDWAKRNIFYPMGYAWNKFDATMRRNPGLRADQAEMQSKALQMSRKTGVPYEYILGKLQQESFTKQQNTFRDMEAQAQDYSAWNKPQGSKATSGTVNVVDNVLPDNTGWSQRAKEANDLNLILRSLAEMNNTPELPENPAEPGYSSGGYGWRRWGGGGGGGGYSSSAQNWYNALMNWDI